jgi:hypothetical protein
LVIGRCHRTAPHHQHDVARLQSGAACRHAADPTEHDALVALKAQLLTLFASE